MRIAFLFLGVAGLFSMYLFFFIQPANFQDYSEIHQSVSLSGVVDSERVISSDFRIFSISNVSVVCSCTSSYLGSLVSVHGFVEMYQGEAQVRVLSIKKIS